MKKQPPTYEELAKQVDTLNQTLECIRQEVAKGMRNLKGYNGHDPDVYASIGLKGFEAVANALKQVTKSGRPLIRKEQFVQLLADYLLKGDGPTLNDNQLVQLIRISLKESAENIAKQTNPDAYSYTGMYGFKEIYQLVMNKKLDNED